MITMNELSNIINLFNDIGLDLYSNIEGNYAETDCASLQSVSEFVNVQNMVHRDFCIYIDYDHDHVIFDRRGCEYLGYWR